MAEINWASAFMFGKNKDWDIAAVIPDDKISKGKLATKTARGKRKRKV